MRIRRSQINIKKICNEFGNNLFYSNNQALYIFTHLNHYFQHMQDEKCADEAIKCLNGVDLHGSRIFVTVILLLHL